MESLTNASYSQCAFYVDKNYIIKILKYFYNQIPPFTTFDKRSTNKTFKTCFHCKKIGHLIKYFCKKLIAKSKGNKRQSNNIATHN